MKAEITHTHSPNLSTFTASPASTQDVLLANEWRTADVPTSARVHALLLLPHDLPLEVEWRVAARFMLQWQIAYLQTVCADVTLVCGGSEIPGEWQSLTSGQQSASLRVIHDIAQFRMPRPRGLQMSSDIVLLMLAPCFTDLALERALSTHRNRPDQLTVVRASGLQHLPYLCIMNAEYVAMHWGELITLLHTESFATIFQKKQLAHRRVTAGHTHYLQTGSHEELSVTAKFWERYIVHPQRANKQLFMPTQSTAQLVSSVTIKGPVMIDRDVTIGAGTTIGPWVMLDAGATVGESCWVEYAHIGAHATLPSTSCIYKAIIEPGAQVRCEKPVLKAHLAANAEELTLLPSLASRHRRSRWQRMCKRALDLTIAMIGIIILLPLLVLIAMLCLVFQGWPITFFHERLGLQGRPFHVYKFRSMRHAKHHDARTLQALHQSDRFKIPNDPRVTRLGRILRKTSLDEIPQIFNVLIGTMSVIGPRPIVTRETERYGLYADDLLRMRPGVTGLWQVSGRTNTTYQRRVMLDVQYGDICSFWYDVWILLRTVPVVLLLSGAE